MIEKKILLYWYKKQHPTGDYDTLVADKITLSLLKERYATLKIRTLFITLFLTLFTYFMFIKSELYESHAAVIVKDLTKTLPSADIGFSLLGAGSSSQLQDSMIIDEYLHSLDMLQLIDKKFHIIKHYKSDAIDFVERLSSNATQEEALKFYNTRIVTLYDETSSILHISFAHTNPKIAQEIVYFMIKQVEFTLNEFNKKKAQRELIFIEKEHKANKEKMEHSAQVLEAYQNKHLLLDPKSEATSSTQMIAKLESSLMQKTIELKTKSSYLNVDNYELNTLRSEIKEMKIALNHAKENLSGKGKNKLNSVLFKFEDLKMQLEFDTTIYKTSLVEYETTRLDTLKEAKMLSIISKPNLPDGYTYPNKPKTFITLLLVTLLFYGIFSMLLAIIKDHKE